MAGVAKAVTDAARTNAAIAFMEYPLRVETEL
jgi:hypothetical protein